MKIRIRKHLLIAVCFALTMCNTTVKANAATLPALPLPNATFTSGNLTIMRYGSGPRTLIFIPGLGSGAWSWAEQISHFSKGDTVYALTLAGFDGTAFVPEPDLFASFSKDFWSFVAGQHLAHPVVIGHSLGGTLAIALAEQHPDELGGIVALEGLPVFPAVAQSTAAQRTKLAQQAAGQISGLTHAQFLATEAQNMQSEGTLNSDLVPASAALEATSDPKAVAAWLVADLDADLRPQLSAISIPFLELAPYAPPAPFTQVQKVDFYQSLVQGAPHVTVEPIPNARHFAMLDQPQAVDDALAQFLASLPSPAGS
ncbi:MAG: alpha/beta fold hydrolase [Vulcanimicrobiaceae bacterium]